MMVIVFRSRLNPGVEEEYGTRAAEVFGWAEKAPGYRSIKDFSADDGERLALIEFESAETLEAWRTHAGHLMAQQQGRERFFSEYSLQICELVRESRFDRRKEVAGTA